MPPTTTPSKPSKPAESVGRASPPASPQASPHASKPNINGSNPPSPAAAYTSPPTTPTTSPNHPRQMHRFWCLIEHPGVKKSYVVEVHAQTSIEAKGTLNAGGLHLVSEPVNLGPAPMNQIDSAYLIEHIDSRMDAVSNQLRKSPILRMRSPIGTITTSIIIASILLLILAIFVGGGINDLRRAR